MAGPNGHRLRFNSNAEEAVGFDRSTFQNGVAISKGVDDSYDR